MINIRLIGQKKYLDRWDIVFRKIGIFGRFFPLKNEADEYALYLRVNDNFLNEYSIFNLETGEIFTYQRGFKCDS